MKQIAVIALAAALVSGCGATAGRKFDHSQVENFQPGVTTISDAKASLGEPVGVITDPDGGQVLQWRYAFVSAFGTKAARVDIAFDKDGKMLRVARKSLVGQ